MSERNCLVSCPFCSGEFLAPSFIDQETAYLNEIEEKYIGQILHVDESLRKMIEDYEEKEENLNEEINELKNKLLILQQAKKENSRHSKKLIDAVNDVFNDGLFPQYSDMTLRQRASFDKLMKYYDELKSNMKKNN
jgi:septal ring factor EnvC (AmiA/AmiB activator)